MFILIFILAFYVANSQNYSYIDSVNVYEIVKLSGINGSNTTQVVREGLASLEGFTWSQKELDLENDRLFLVTISLRDGSSSRFENRLPSKLNFEYLSSINLKNAKFSQNNIEFDTPNLMYLTLSQNRFSGKIKINSNKIRELDLSLNQFEGTLDISEMVLLNRLQINNNSFDSIATNIPLLVLSNLRVFNNKLKSIDFIQNIPNLVEIIAHNNRIIYLPEVVSHPEIRNFAINFNQINLKLPQFDMPQLKLLNLNDNLFFGSAKIPSLPNLESVKYSYNRLSNFEYPPSHLNLKSLYLTRNKLIDTFALGFMPRLDTLDISYNQITHLDDSLFIKAPVLKFLNITNCKFTFEALSKFTHQSSFYSLQQDTTYAIIQELENGRVKLKIDCDFPNLKYQWIHINDLTSYLGNDSTLYPTNPGTYYCLLNSDLVPRVTIESDRFDFQTQVQLDDLSSLKRIQSETKFNMWLIKTGWEALYTQAYGIEYILSNNELPVYRVSSINLEFNRLDGNLSDLKFDSLKNANFLSNSIRKLNNIKLHTPQKLDFSFNKMTEIDNFSFISIDSLLLKNNLLSRVNLISEHESNYIDLSNNKLCFDQLENLNFKTIHYQNQDTILDLQVEGITLEVLCGGSSNLYKWYINDELIPNLNTQSITLNKEGIYHCEVENTKFPLLSLRSENFDYRPSSIDNEEKVNFEILSNVLSINLAGNYKIEIYDITGKVLYSEHLAKGQHNLNNNLSKGLNIIYIYEESGKLIYNNKLLKN